jgi:glycerol-1-phosphate dehydrogenase [NAD(P)+]
MNKTCQMKISIPSILKIYENALDDIGDHLKEANFDNIAVFYSAGIENIYGQRIENSLKSYGVNIVHKLTIDEIDIENIIHTAFSIPKSVNALVGIGGGKALDYSKYCSHVLALPFVSVPTSTSNDGFCSPNSSLFVEKKRKSVNARIPYGVIVDINAVKDSPESCIYSGIGDLISKITAGWDWKMAVEKELEDFNDFAYLISQNTVIDFLNYQKQDIRSNKFIYHLVNSLLMSGISMEIAGSSRPASGSEHLISHSLDMITSVPTMHGLQVGFATYLCSYLQNNQFNLVKDFLTNTGFFEYLYENPMDKAVFIEALSKADKVKENFYTILSEPETINKCLDFISKDNICQKILV